MSKVCYEHISLIEILSDIQFLVVRLAKYFTIDLAVTSSDLAWGGHVKQSARHIASDKVLWNWRVQ